MIQAHNKEDILSALAHSTYGILATHDEKVLRTRTVHFAHDNDLNLYFASMKGDPKIRQIQGNPEVSILINQRTPEEVDTAEVEVSGLATVVEEERQRQELFPRLAVKSPVVKSLMDGGMTHVLDVVKVTPQRVRFRIFREIVRGVPPTVLELAPAEPRPTKTTPSWRAPWPKVRLWAQEVRAPFLTASAVPILLGTAVAWAATGQFHLGYFLLTLVGGVCLQIGANVSNDYFDHLSAADDINKEYVRPFTGGSRMIQRGLLSPKEVLIEALVFFTLGSLVGLYLTWARGPFVLALGLVGVFSAFFYTAPPIRLVNRGVGEIFIGLNFGVLMTLGAYMVQTQAFSWQPVMASIPVSLLIAAVLYINEFPDYAADKAVGKNHWVVRLGRRRAVAGYDALMIATYVSIATGVVLGWLPYSAPWSLPLFALLGFVSLPKALNAMKVAKLYHSESVYLVPANAGTVMSHLLTGLLLAAGFVVDGLWRLLVAPLLL